MMKHQCACGALAGLLGLTAALLFLVIGAPNAGGPRALQARAAAGQAEALPVTPHSLDPLTEKELETAVRVLRGDKRVAAGAFFPLLSVNEPPKEEVLAAASEKPARREALGVVLDRAGNRTAEAVVDLRAEKVIRWLDLPGVQPAMLAEEVESTAELVRKDERWRKAMSARGITDYASIQFDAWPGPAEKPEHRGGRLMRVLSFVRGSSSNAYARPVEGVVVLVDMHLKKVLEVVDRRPAFAPPADSGDFFDPKTIGPLRPALPPLRTEQPGGRSFEVRGQEVRWQNWTFRQALHPRDGLMLYAVTYQDGKKRRPIVYRASLSEIVVPYGDPTEGTWHWRSAFDEGEYLLGIQAIPLRPGHEVPANAMVLPVPFASDVGTVRVRKGLVAIYERDGGLLWSHSDYVTGRVATRRARELVVQSIYVLGNYDYSFQWIFHQDGTLEHQIELTGVLLAKGAKSEKCQRCSGDNARDAEDRYGELVAKNVIATNHQHVFCYRLDLDVDGPRNSVQEIDVVAVPPPEGEARRTAFVAERRTLRTELEAQRDVGQERHRCWRVFNPNQTTELGHNPGYVLRPGPVAGPLAHPGELVRRRAGFLDHALWVTRYRPGQLYAAGNYVTQNEGDGDGLPRWSRANAALVNQDCVLWYVMGMTHVPRPEEWPVMPAARHGFRLVPDGFFTRNPALDVPPEAP